jgi:hypothetical protein
MPARSKAQQRLFAAAEHNAQFPMARSIRASMTQGQMHDFAVTKSKGLPAHVAKAGHPSRNLGHHLHPKKGK